jgi:hypothetical protein
VDGTPTAEEHSQSFHVYRTGKKSIGARVTTIDISQSVMYRCHIRTTVLFHKKNDKTTTE